MIASRAVADELAAALAEQAQAVRFSRDEEPDSDDLYIPPINNADQLAKVSGLVDRLPSHARVLTGGSAAGGAGYFYTPTVVAGVQQDDEIARNEIFGPIITVQTFADEAEALELANDTPYGLASSVFTTDHSRALRMSRALEFGCVWINTHIPLVAEMPHGGFKESGLRQGPLGVLAGGLHAGQARDERGGRRMTAVEVQGGPALPQERRLVTEIPGPVSREWTERRLAAVSNGGVGDDAGVRRRRGWRRGRRRRRQLADRLRLRHRGDDGRQRGTAGRRGRAGAGRSGSPTPAS